MNRPTKIIRLIVAILFFAVAVSAQAQANFQTLLVGVDHRTTTSLNGDWHYLVDQSPAQALHPATSV
jgi:beta-glucuronidase